MADYTAKEIDPEAAAKLVEEAEKYIRTVGRVFGLELDPLEIAPKDQDKKRGREPAQDQGFGHEPDES
jgi:hypothetical protein